MNIRQIIFGEWRIRIPDVLGYRIRKEKNGYKAIYPLTALRASGASSSEAIEILEKKISEMGLETDDIIWMQWRRLASIVVILAGLVLVGQTTVSNFPLFILLSLERNRTEHAKILNELPPGGKQAYMDRLCETMLHLRYGDDSYPLDRRLAFCAGLPR